MGKFDRRTSGTIYFKHDNCLDVFFAVNKVSFDDDGRKAVLKGTWCTQGVERWWFTCPARIVIRKEYDKWEPYTPKGMPKL